MDTPKVYVTDTGTSARARRITAASYDGELDGAYVSVTIDPRHGPRAALRLLARAAIEVVVRARGEGHVPAQAAHDAPLARYAEGGRWNA